MPHRDFDTLFEKLESNLAFANDAAFMNELKAGIETAEQWARLVSLYCKAANRMIDFVLDTPIPN